MIYGENILSRSPADWYVVNGIMTTTSISLNAGGSATQQLNSEDLLAIPAQFYLLIIADQYMDPYAPSAFVYLRVLNDKNEYAEYSIPLVDTGNGYCTVTFPADVDTYKTLYFTITSYSNVTITDWVLSGPVADKVAFDELRHEIPKVLDDYNEATFTVGQEEVSIGYITAELLQNTDLNGHLLLTYFSEVFTVLHIRIKDNNTTELFTPILYNIVPGRGSIGIPHAFLRKLVGVHTFTVSAQVSVGTITVLTRGMLFTIDGGYMAKRLMDIDVNFSDLTVMQLPSESEPSRLYAVGVEEGMARVRSRPAEGGSGVTWEPEYEVGPAVEAAIEFNGVWAERIDDIGYTLLTEDVPWVFWIDAAGALFGQKGLDETTRVPLATGVSTLSVTRGFKSFQVLENDQGLVVAYIKSGKVYIRNYCTQVNGLTTWELEQEITAAGTGVTAAYVGRLNDYRLSLAVTGASGNKLFITGRTYVGQAFKSDNAKYVDASIFGLRYDEIIPAIPAPTEEEAVMSDAFISFQYGSSTSDFYPPSLNYFETSEDGKTLYMVFDCDFYRIDTVDPSKVFTNAGSTLLSISHVSANTLALVFSSAVNTTGTLSITFSGMHQAGYYRGGPVWFAGMAWIISFDTPEPTEYDEEAKMVDASIPYFQYARIVPVSNSIKEEEVKFVDASVSNIQLTPIGADPI